MLYSFAAFLLLVLGLLLWRDYGRPSKPQTPPPAPATKRRPRARQPEILVDGSNVMWWDGDTSKLETLIALVNLLQVRGFRPGVIFDATAGHKLFGGYRDDAFMARAMGLPDEQVLVVPKGEVADRFLLLTARQRGLSIITRDRYRDWLEDFPEAREMGRLIRGGFGPEGLWVEERLLQQVRQAKA